MILNPSALGTSGQLGDFYLAHDVVNSINWDGGECDVQLFSITLSQAQVTAIYDAGAQ